MDDSEARVIAERLMMWVSALRGPKYRQGRRVLHRKDGRMCCLGVACDLAVPGAWLDGARPDCMIFTGMGGGGMGGNDTIPSKAVQAYYGLSTADVNELMRRNDTLGQDFEAIADYIQSNIVPRYRTADLQLRAQGMKDVATMYAPDEIGDDPASP